MAEPFLGEIRITSFNFAPKGWALCNGQQLAINTNQALFAILGTTYGGDGIRTFALPNLQGSVAMHVGPGHVLGERGGEQDHALSVAEIPAHSHGLNGSSDFANSADPADHLLASKSRGGKDIYTAPAALTALAPNAIGNAGQGQPHSNMQPYLTLNFVIALQGIFPSQN